VSEKDVLAIVSSTNGKSEAGLVGAASGRAKK